MPPDELDEIDMGILHMLQKDARNITPVDMADRLPVSDGTVRNRIEGLEEHGIIQGYVPVLDYEAAGYPLRVVFECTAPLDRRADLAREALGSTGVVDTREMIAARGNVWVTVVAKDTSDITKTARELVELGLRIEDELLARREFVRPFDGFERVFIKS